MKVNAGEIIKRTKPDFKTHFLCRHIKVTKEWLEDDIIGTHVKALIEGNDKHNR